MPLDVQVNLLRLLQNREVVRIGGQRARRVDIRIIAATNKNLYNAVQSKTFREDLYYRLNVFPLHIPPLRERQGDVALLARHFMEKFSRQSGKTLRGISRSALDALQRYSWPGNIRELENVMERAVYMASGTEVTLKELPEVIAGRESERMQKSAEERPCDRGEKAALEAALRASRGRIADALKLLNMNRSTFYYRLKRYGIRPADFRHDLRMSEWKNAAETNPLLGLRAEEMEALAGLARELCRNREGS